MAGAKRSASKLRKEHLSRAAGGSPEDSSVVSTRASRQIAPVTEVVLFRTFIDEVDP